MPICVADSIQPGVTIFPVASTMRAPAGTWTAAPTAAILPAWITTVPRSIAGPDTGNTRALVMAIVSPAATGAGAARRGACRGAGRVVWPAIDTVMHTESARTAALLIGHLPSS